jgi:predicted dehydrogenase
VYGTRGSAILEPFEPAGPIRLCLLAPAAGFPGGEQHVPVPVQSRQALYEAELAAFLDAVRGIRPPDRPLAHELLVQETLLRATGGIAP